MTTVHEARSFLAAVLGTKATSLFDDYLEDFFCCVKSWALTDLQTPPSDVRQKLENVLRGIIGESIKTYLHEHYSEVNVSKDHVFDKNMREIPAIVQIRTHHVELVSCMLDKAMVDFEKGRKLASSVINRARQFSSDPPPLSRHTPLESYEVEIMRLERRLPSISARDARQLGELYRLVREAECAGT